ncbi:hypothetical protein V5O48_005306 [Marasmius crinis-equi]|uniref:Uncharacterized protein n=1 Tax=Marasmius crinis-equi TaxID=585013 RepID=A0ABR3FNL5_9AGAR
MSQREANMMSRTEAQALYEVDIPEEDYDEYERTEGEVKAKADWKRLVEERAAEIRANRKHLSSTKRYNCLEDEYYLSRYHTIESQVKRELGGNPRQWFVNLYRELILWHDAERPTLSPVEHAVSIFDTLDISTSSLLNWISLRKAEFPIPEERTRQFGELQRLTQFLTECASELNDAVEAEDGMASLKHDYKGGSLKFMGRELRESTVYLNSYTITQIVNDSIGAKSDQPDNLSGVAITVWKSGQNPPAESSSRKILSEGNTATYLYRAVSTQLHDYPHGKRNKQYRYPGTFVR